MKHDLALLFALFLTGPAHAQCELQKLTASDGATDDRFGAAVDIEGPTAIVGAELVGPSGAAYVFMRDAGGTWTETDHLTSQPAFGGDVFGRSVALSGFTALIGAPNVALIEGNAYVFTRTPSGWTQSQRLRASDGHGDSWFGSAVSIDGDTAVVGARRDDGAGEKAGAAYVFELVDGTWEETAKLVAADTTDFDYFGDAVSISGDTIVVGAPRKVTWRGSAYVFERNGSTWTETAKLKSGIASRLFGSSVSVSGSTVFVGSHGYFTPRLSTDSAVFVYERTPGGWPLAQRLVTTRPQTTADWFGHSVSVSGDLGVVGAYRDHSPGYDGGAVYFYRRTDAGWTETAKATGSDSDVEHWFGSAVAIDSGTVLVGAEKANANATRTGAAYVLSVAEAAVPYCFTERVIWDQLDTPSIGDVPALPCPCANRGDTGEGCRNSTGVGALLMGCGTTSVGADDFLLRARQVPPNQFGLVFMGAGGADVPFGDGVQCIAPGTAGVFRYPVQSSGADGALVEGPGIVAHSTANFGAAGTITAGSTWRFQGWFRDPQGPCGAGFNLSNALAVTFEP